MENYKGCVALNAKAISLIQAGSCDEGIAYLTKALALLQPFFQDSEPLPSGPVSSGSSSSSSSPPSAENPPAHEDDDMEVESDTTQDDDEIYFKEDEESLFQLPAYFSVPVVSSEDCTYEPLLSSDDQVFTFYDRMFEITETDIVRNLGVSKTFVLLLFNFAMAHHIHAAKHHIERQEATPNREFRLSAILQMYESATVAAKSSLTADELGEILCVIIAANNNIGHLQSFLHNFAKVQCSLTLQLQLIGLSYGPCAIPVVDYAILFSSVFVFLEGPGLCLAPAA